MSTGIKEEVILLWPKGFGGIPEHVKNLYDSMLNMHGGVPFGKTQIHRDLPFLSSLLGYSRTRTRKMDGTTVSLVS